MTNMYLKTIGSSLLVAAFLFLAAGSDDSSKNDKEEATSSSEVTSNETNEQEEPAENSEVAIESKIGSKIISDVYESNENGLKTYLKFEESEDSGGMFGSLTLSNNATSCKYVYTYSISEYTISADFFQSDCGANADDQTFTYDESTNIISCYINGQKFDFKSIF